MQRQLNATFGSGTQAAIQAYEIRIAELKSTIGDLRTIQGSVPFIGGVIASDKEIAERKRNLAEMEAQLKRLRDVQSSQQASDDAKLKQITAPAPSSPAAPDAKAAEKARREAEREIKQQARLEAQAEQQRLQNQRAFADASLSVDQDLNKRQQAELKASFDAKLISAEEYYRALQDVRLADLNAEIEALRLKQQATKDEGDFVKLDAEIIILERQRGDVARETAAAIAKASQDEADSLRDLQDKYDATGAAVRKYRDDYAKLHAAFSSGKLSSDEFNLYADNIGKGLNKIVKDGNDMADGLSEFAVQGARSMQSAFADFLFDPFAKGTKSMGEQFLEVVRRMVANAASAQLMDALFGKGFASSSGSSSGLGGLFGAVVSGLGGVFGGASGGAASSAGLGISSSIDKFLPTLSTSKYHQGGIVGLGAQGVRVPAYAFDHAPRYHAGGLAGLMPGEVPAILKAGEEVLTASDPRHVLNGGGAMQVHIHEAPGTRASVQQGQDQNGPRLDVIIEQITARMGQDIRRGGGIAPDLEGRYRLNPANGGLR